ncbi:MAG: hypothetical protein AB2693_02260 [Candidatus Thiodiazotropha sp.]
MDLSQESFSRCLWQRCGKIQQCELRMTVQRITNLFRSNAAPGWRQGESLS